MKTIGYALITGGAGFIGSNIADSLLTDGEPVVLLDNFSRDGSWENVRWLQGRHGDRVRIHAVDVIDALRLAPLVAGASRIFHLAAQVAVTTSLGDPAADLRTNLLGTFNVLEAARRLASPPPILFASTNKVYGDLGRAAVQLTDGAYRYVDERHGIDEEAPLDFQTPYGCSKGAADQYVCDYARVYGLPTVVFRLSCVYGRRQFGTEDQGWVAHFARSLLAGETITIYGDGCQVRDILYVDDAVRAMRAALDRIDATAGQVFNIGGGVKNAVSVRRVLDHLAKEAGVPVSVRSAPWRPGDQKIYVSDITKAERRFGWAPTTSWPRGLEKLVAWLVEQEARAWPAYSGSHSRGFAAGLAS